MFEFSDEKIGRFKVINITEARASMATIMGDKESNYIVTKNNRPVRVIINYDAYKKNQAGSLIRSAKGTEAKDLLKGLIESKEKDLKRQIDMENSSVMPDTPVQSPVRENIVPPASQTPLVEKEEAISPSISNKVVSDDSKETVEVMTPSPNTPPPDNDYFNRFKKLYEAPRYDSFSGIAMGAKAPPLGEASFEGPSPSQTMARQTMSPETMPDEEVKGYPMSKMPPETPLKASISFKSSNPNDPPSIQDLLMELEGEKLSGDDDSLSTHQVNQLLNRITK